MTVEQPERTYRDLAPTLRTGDIYLAAGIRKISLRIRMVSGLARGRWKADWSHVGMIVIPSELGITNVADPEAPHLWESTIDLDVADALWNDTRPGPMLVPLADRLRGATADEEPHYERFAIRRLERGQPAHGTALAPKTIPRFTRWMSEATHADFNTWKMAVDWAWSLVHQYDLRNHRRLETRPSWVTVPMRFGRLSSVVLLLVLLLLLPTWLVALVLALEVSSVRELMMRWGDFAITRFIARGWRKLRDRDNYPCSILAANSFAVLGVLDTTAPVIPAFTPDDFAHDRVPLQDGYRFGPIEEFSFLADRDVARPARATAAASG